MGRSGAMGGESEYLQRKVFDLLPTHWTGIFSECGLQPSRPDLSFHPSEKTLCLLIWAGVRSAALKTRFIVSPMPTNLSRGRVWITACDPTIAAQSTMFPCDGDVYPMNCTVERRKEIHVLWGWDWANIYKAYSVDIKPARIIHAHSPHPLQQTVTIFLRKSLKYCLIQVLCTRFTGGGGILWIWD